MRNNSKKTSHSGNDKKKSNSFSMPFSKPKSNDKEKDDKKRKPFGDKKHGVKHNKFEGVDKEQKSFSRTKPSHGDENKKPFEKREKGTFTKNKSTVKFQKNNSFEKDEKEYSKPFAKKEIVDKNEGNKTFKKGGDFKNKGTYKRFDKKFSKKGTPNFAEKVGTENVSGLVRLNKYISNSGVCSRREADDLIVAGAVSINGKVITDLSTRVKLTDIVSYGGQPIKRERNVYILLNKPKNYITTADDPQERKTVLELIKGACKERVYPVGRLDRNTTGLLILTNDGELTKLLTHPRYEKKKIYQVSLDKPMKKEDMDVIAEGVELEDGITKVDEISYVKGEPKTEVGVELHSGKNRIVRRIFESVGYEVKKLDRVYFAGITKKNLARGRWRFLTDSEVAILKTP